MFAGSVQPVPSNLLLKLPNASKPTPIEPVAMEASWLVARIASSLANGTLTTAQLRCAHGHEVGRDELELARR